MSNVTPFERNDLFPETGTAEPGSKIPDTVSYPEWKRQKTRRYKASLFFRIQLLRSRKEKQEDGSTQEPSARKSADASDTPPLSLVDPPQSTDTGPGLHVEAGALAVVEES